MDDDALTCPYCDGVIDVWGGTDYDYDQYPWTSLNFDETGLVSERVTCNCPHCGNEVEYCWVLMFGSRMVPIATSDPEDIPEEWEAT